MFGSFTTVPAPKGNKNPESTPSWMDVAKSQDIPEPVAEAVPSYAPTTRVQQLTRNVLNSDVEVIGSLRFSDDLLIDGTVEGDISSEGVLSVGQNAVIRAEINTKSVIIHGKVIGNVTVTDRVELKSTAELVGDIQAASLAIEGGAIFIGHSTVGAPTVGATGASAAKKAASVHAFAPEPAPPAPASQSTLDIDAEYKTLRLLLSRAAKERSVLLPPSLFHEPHLPSRPPDQRRALWENQPPLPGAALDTPANCGKQPGACPGGGMLLLPQNHFRPRHGSFRQVRPLLRVYQTGRRHFTQQNAPDQGANLRKRYRTGQCSPERAEHRMP
ncbi:MAG: bactofilin family protein [Akkermansia muciniphila]